MISNSDLEFDIVNNVYVVDTSAIIDGRIIKLVENESITGTLIIPKEILTELEFQANTKKEVGFAGLKVVKDLIELQKTKKIKIEFEGTRRFKTTFQKTGDQDLDFLIRELALELNATLITCDTVQKELAKILSINVIYLEPEEKTSNDLPFLNYFDEYTMSVHLKEYCKPLAKKGYPGNVKLVEIDSKELTPKELRNLGSNIIELAKQDYNSFIEQDAQGYSIVQL
ncbi:MAG: PIN domain-containing protein, partial [Candidatus Micrarchaeota archaeon]|nr:PIN domain-containing protein [Candidatus Micrarchaeota archaeon]